MAFRVIHLVDSTTSADAAEVLSQFLNAERTTENAIADRHHEVFALGHRATAAVLEAARIPDALQESITWLPSLGRWDPRAWRTLAQKVHPGSPTLLHAWGLDAAVACAACNRPAGRLVTLDVDPEASAIVFRKIEKGRSNSKPVHWLTFYSHLANRLRQAGCRAVSHIPMAISRLNVEISPLQLREQLGILPEDGPIFLAACDASRHSRHDYALWAGGIVQQIFPRVRVVVREDLRGRPDHGLQRLLDNLADPELAVLAPATLSWDVLLSIADLLLVTADGPVDLGAVMHAKAAGVPVVGTPIPAVQELIEHGRTGLIASSLKPRALAAHIEELLSNPALLNRLVSEARLQVMREGSPDAMIEAIRRAYDEAGYLAAI